MLNPVLSSNVWRPPRHGYDQLPQRTISGQILRIGTVRYAEGLWRMRRYGPVIAHCTDSEDFSISDCIKPYRTTYDHHIGSCGTQDRIFKNEVKAIPNNTIHRPRVKCRCADFRSGKLLMFMRIKIRTLPTHMPYAVSAHLHVTIYHITEIVHHNFIKQQFMPYTLAR